MPTNAPVILTMERCRLDSIRTLADLSSLVADRREVWVDVLGRVLAVDTSFPPGRGYAALADVLESLFAPLSALYQRTISTLDRRVHVSGSPEFLQRNEVAAKIRTLLLAGVRSAWLWHQSGGRRWHLILRRSTIRNMLTTLARPSETH